MGLTGRGVLDNSSMNLKEACLAVCYQLSAPNRFGILVQMSSLQTPKLHSRSCCKRKQTDQGHRLIQVLISLAAPRHTGVNLLVKLQQDARE